MPPDEPSWWYSRGHSKTASLLAPISHLYGWAAQRRYQRRRPYRSRIPVICVGNFTAGGTGKTPLAISIACALLENGEQPVFLTRGWRGRLAGPHWVDPQRDRARDVGDEPLLLARFAPAMVARDRRAGAIAIETGGTPATVIIMDDGLQNPSLRKDLSIAVVDGDRGVGNGAVIPSGPLRAPLEFQLGLVDAVIVNERPGRIAMAARGDGEEGQVLTQLKRGFPGPVLAAEAIPHGETSWLRDAKVAAFAGIGNPRRFYSLLESLGARLTSHTSFADHHTYSEGDAERLMLQAAAEMSILVTTEKDLVRLSGTGGHRRKLMEVSRVLPIRLAFAGRDAARLGELLDAVLKNGGYRAGLRQS